MMKSSVRVTPLAQAKTGLVVLAVRAAKKPPTLARDLDAAVGGAIQRAFAAGDFAGGADETLLLYPEAGPKRLLLVGLGTGDGVTAVRRAAAVATRRATKLGAATVAFGVEPGRDDIAALARAATEGAGQGAWTFEALRSERVSKGDVKQFAFHVAAAGRTAAERGRQVGAAVAAGQTLARTLQMRPGNHCTPADLAREARALGRRHGCKVTVKRRAQLETEGLHALLAVAQGSAEEPRLITLEYRGAGNARPICLVGKGVTFDAGGISLKPPLRMEDMKFDMSGAAAVLGAFEAIGRIRPRVNVVGVIPATENLPSGTAVKPGDVIRTHRGKTVEVINTDAEGRLILSDALSYARRFKPTCIVDAATLTGAIVIALGDEASGLMGTDEELVAELRAAGDAVDERCWPLPLWDGYRDLLKSDTADIKNTGGRAAGSITAGWFLREFVDAETPWAHLDIAGTAYLDRDRPHVPKGPTGVGVRLFTEFVLRRAGG